ncbi:hypothetical protein WJX74_003499 [Apatococcus lobatus]|uniref:Uncharacterized protein n=1 Tax=Apatococcus lobatus TaxID=904363 RepID=A0AAW1RWI5_9CHLO
MFHVCKLFAALPDSMEGQETIQHQRGEHGSGLPSALTKAHHAAINRADAKHPDQEADCFKLLEPVASWSRHCVP